MRLTVFWQRMDEHFGPGHADTFARDHVMTELGGRTVLRLAIGNVRTEERHVQKAWDQIRNAVGLVNR